MKDRLKEIVKIVQREKEVSVSKLSNKLGISEVTIRKDLDVLEKQGQILRVHGGATDVSQRNVPPYFARLNIEQEEKQQIAIAASQLIEKGDSVIIDAGSTALAVSKLLKDKNVSIVTVSLPVGMELTEFNGTISMTSGEIHKGSLALTGPDTERYLEKLKVNKLVLGTSGFRLDQGFTASSTIEAAVKQKMIKAAEKVILVTDHTKFSKIKIALFAVFADIDVVVTSDKIPKEALDSLNENGIEVITVRSG